MRWEKRKPKISTEKNRNLYDIELIFRARKRGRNQRVTKSNVFEEMQATTKRKQLKTFIGRKENVLS